MHRFGQGHAGQGLRQFRSGPVKVAGSGFIVDPSGYVVTNNHVVENGSDIKVTLQDGTSLNAKIVGVDAVADIAVLKISAGHPLPSVSFGDSAANRASATGSSRSATRSAWAAPLTAGIVSASGRDVPSENRSAYVDYLQIDAPINQGNSGGPTFNEDAKVISINTAIYSPNGGGSVGIGFAIPSNLAKSVVDRAGKEWRGDPRLARRPDAGHYARAWKTPLGLSTTNRRRHRRCGVG